MDGIRRLYNFVQITVFSWCFGHFYHVTPINFYSCEHQHSSFVSCASLHTGKVSRIPPHLGVAVDWHPAATAGEE